DNAGSGKQQPSPASTAKPSQAAAPAPKAEDVVATVNGKPISKESVAIMTSEIEQRRGPNSAPQDKIVDELISRELLRQEAEKQNLAAEPSNAARLENTQRIMLSQMAAENFIKNVAVTDEDLKKEYDQRVAAMKRTEYKARHILVEKEAEAKDIIAKLQKGAKFADLAKKLSKDPGSKENGGDLGWFSPQQMVPPFSEAVAKLKNGETTAAPVQSQFGWHVILREDEREQAPPPFDQVKEQIKSMMQTQKLQQHIADLKTAAKIERAAPPKPPESPKPAAAVPAEGGEQEKDESMEAGKPEPATAEPAKPAAATPAPAKPAGAAPTSAPKPTK
ncbi:MAG: peptidyl-prolyl cis-trans isomerase family protein, partial [Proteobacteria bacterium]|nr:peptidyl-prolyl cis-trans isomerase family protein [Pseudomonadota bacterium]